MLLNEALRSPFVKLGFWARPANETKPSPTLGETQRREEAGREGWSWWQQGHGVVDHVSG